MPNRKCKTCKRYSSAGFYAGLDSVPVPMDMQSMPPRK